MTWHDQLDITNMLSDLYQVDMYQMCSCCM
jgi:hypothetical protein